jgi:YesN/AraC family two-component response regulator
VFDSLKNKTILYVEDELDVLDNISELFENYFGKIYTASDGEMGYSIFLEKRLDILFIDIELPKMNGIELIKKIRERDENICIVVVSAYTKNDYFLDCAGLKIDKCIIKPFTTKKINELLKHLDGGFAQSKSDNAEE